MIWIFRRHSDSVLEATKHERQDAIERLISQGTFGSGYYLMLCLSTLIVTPGLLMQNFAVVIGGMILAPLMVPHLSLSLSLVSGNLYGCLRSIRILLLSVLIVIATSVVTTFVLYQTEQVVSWIPQDISPGVYIFIAFCSGVAGSFAWVKENLSSSMAGVAISVSLLPPLCAAGIGLALWQAPLVKNSMILFVANLIGICLGAFLVFWILGFLNEADREQKVIEKHEDK